MRAIFSALAVRLGLIDTKYIINKASISFKLIIRLDFADPQLCQTSTDTRRYKILPFPVLKGD